MANFADETFRGTSRFEITRRLGAGAFGVVYEAFDRERNCVVALKTLRAHRGRGALPAQAGVPFHLPTSRTPTSSRCTSCFPDGHLWFFDDGVRRGRTPATVRARSGRLPDTADRMGSARFPSGDRDCRAPVDAGPRITARLPSSVRPTARFHLGVFAPRLRRGRRPVYTALHTAGKLHRDIKSSNVLVTRLDRVVLLDFGLVTGARSGRRQRRKHGDGRHSRLHVSRTGRR